MLVFLSNSIITTFLLINYSLGPIACSLNACFHLVILNIFVCCTLLYFILKFRGDLFSLVAQLVKNLPPGSGRSAGKGIGYSLQYSVASLVAQMVKNPLVMQENWVWSLHWEDTLEKGKTTHSSILAWKISWTMRCERLGCYWATFTFNRNHEDVHSK